MIHVLLFLCVLYISCFVCRTQSLCQGPLPQAEFSALYALYVSANGSEWAWNQTFPSSTHWRFPNDLAVPCSNSWQGLSCEPNLHNSTLCSVYGIQLSLFNLVGVLPTELGLLSQLQLLNLGGNHLSSNIPSELGQLTQLQQIGLNLNHLRGDIPTEFGQLVQIEQLLLGENRLEGSIPSEMGQLSQLELFSLHWNRHTGTIPTELGQLSLLQVLILSMNNLTGHIPTELGLVAELKEFDIYGNGFSGTLPTELGQLKQLEILVLNKNQFSGSIPMELGQLNILKVLYLDYNMISGSIPSELGSLSQLQQLYLQANRLAGVIPTELGLLSLLQQLYLNMNSFVGCIPTEIGQLSQLQVLAIYDNDLSGSISSHMGDMAELQILYLYNNSLTGSIPTELGELAQLQQLFLQDNCLESAIPTELGQLLRLQDLYLSVNSFTGRLPAELGQLSQLQTLYLNDNSLDGEVPTELGQLSKLQLLYLNGNSIEGSLPSEIRRLSNIRQLYLQENMLSSVDVVSTLNLTLLNVSNNLLIGSIPPLPSTVEYVNFRGNKISGSISNTLSNCSRIAFFDVSDNQLTGTIPVYFAEFHHIESINVSLNRLSGSLDSLVVNRPSKIDTIDASRNQFTGTVPTNLFSLPLLVTLLLHENCFSGTVPDAICNSIRLQNAYLDSLTGNCGSLVPVSLRSIISASIPKKLIKGSIPTCIWSMATLKLLHLQGNGLTGTLGELSDIASLSVVMLASNALTGSIPISWQAYGMFTQLDLSSNKLDGTLSNKFAATEEATVLDLTVNRLSGHIPHAFQNNSVVVDMLNGNLFQCQVESIPQQDPNHNKYVCGSSDLNVSLQFALALLSFGILALVLVAQRTEWLNLGRSATIEILCLYESNTFKIIKLIFIQSLLGLLFYLLLKLMPAWMEFTTHDSQYAWTVSAVYLHGWLPVFGILLMLLASACYWIVLEGNSMNAGKSMRHKASLKRWLGIGLMHTLNLVIVLAVNGTYVDLVLAGLSTWNLFWVQIALSLFKLSWSSVGIPYLMSFVFVDKFDSVSHATVMTLVSFIVGPFVSTFFTSSDCFKDLFVGKSHASSTSLIRSYSCINNCYSACAGDICKVVCVHICGFIQQLQLSLLISPPWMYSYQCSSSLVIDYAPVMIYSVVISDFARPLLEIAYLFTPVKVIQCALRHVPSSLIRQYLHGTVYAIDSEQAMQLNKHKHLLQPHQHRQKTLLAVAIFFTFGTASPLLSLIIIGALMMQNVRNRLLLGRMLGLVSTNPEMQSEMLRRVSDHLPDITCGFAEIYAVFVVSYMFWGLFVFDMIGDVYGGLAGGLSVLVPSVMIAIVSIIQQRSMGASQIEESTVIPPEIEMIEMHVDPSLT